MKILILMSVIFLVGCSLVQQRIASKMGSNNGYYSNSNAVQTNPGVPQVDAYGRPYQHVPADGSQGPLLGPVKENVYGLGIGSDATGRPANRAAWRQN